MRRAPPFKLFPIRTASSWSTAQGCDIHVDASFAAWPIATGEVASTNHRRVLGGSSRRHGLPLDYSTHAGALLSGVSSLAPPRPVPLSPTPPACAFSLSRLARLPDGRRDNALAEHPTNRSVWRRSLSWMLHPSCPPDAPVEDAQHVLVLQTGHRHPAL